MVGLAFTMAEPYPGESRIVNMIKSCCVHNGGRTWCDFSGSLVGGVPCGEGSESKVGGTSAFCCRHQWVNNTFHKTGNPETGEAARKIRRQLAQAEEAMAQLRRTGEVDPLLARNLAKQPVRPQGPELQARVTHLQQKQQDLDRNEKQRRWLTGVSG